MISQTLGLNGVFACSCDDLKIIHLCSANIHDCKTINISTRQAMANIVFSILADQDRVWTPDVNNVVDEASGSKIFAVNQPFVCYIES